MSISASFLHIANEQSPDAVLLGFLSSLLALFALWCTTTWLVAQVNIRLAIAIAPPLMKTALAAGLIVSLAPTAHANESHVEAVNGLALPERPLVEEPTTPRGIEPPANANVGATRDLELLNSSEQANSTSSDQPEISETSNQKAKRSDSTKTDIGAAYVVQTGDSLWRIAANHLKPNATDNEIANAVRDWHQLNSDVIGTDPNLIHPRQHLKEPQS